MPVASLNIGTSLIIDMMTTINELSTIINDLVEGNSVNITNGTINNVVIGAGIPRAGTFTTLRVSQSIDLTNTTIVIQNDAINGDKIHGGTISEVVVELPAAPTTNIQATNKGYVDTQITEVQTQLQNDTIAFAIVFGG